MTLPLDLMDDATLCFAWRTSYVALQRSLPPSSTLLVVQRRQDILDDLERRNPGGLAAWLAAGPRAAGDPTKYVTAFHDRTRRDSVPGPD